ncbi:MAG: UTP--glucose-1-phosphate uridylyltransferase, partial [Candidatus Eremiobacterota bacterium]
MRGDFSPFAGKMREAGLSEPHIAAFESHYAELVRGGSGYLRAEHLEPVQHLPVFEEGGTDGRDLLQRTVVIRLNGGLGTTMGLSGPKSLLPVREGRTFLDLAVGQHLAGAGEAALVFMNSFHTSQETRQALDAYPPVSRELPWELVQSRVPKVREADLTPASCPEDPDLEWCPPGHGDLYPTLWSSGFLDTALNLGYRYAFVSNIDN